MFKERIKRLGIILGVAVLVVFLGLFLNRWWEKKKALGRSIFPTEVQIERQIVDLGGGLLGAAVKILPIDPGIKEKLGTVTGGEKTEEKVAGAAIDDNKANSQKQIEELSQEIIGILKKLPEQQVKEIKRQIFKDFCQEVMGQ